MYQRKLTESHILQCNTDLVWLSDTEMEQHLDGIAPPLLGPEPIKFVNQIKEGSGKILIISRYVSSDRALQSILERNNVAT